MMINQKTIDLHNLCEVNATPKILLALYELENNHMLSNLKIITGKGEVLRYLAIRLVEQEDFKWEYDGQNDGAIIVYK